MIFPYGDDNIKGGHKPIFSYSLIAINVVVFIFQVSFGREHFISIIHSFGAIPHHIMLGEGWFTIISHMFLHGDLFHLLFNMLFLWIFADNIEATIGNIPFIIFYFFGGLFALGLQMIMDLNSMTVMVGASGAISAVMGAYLVMFPKSKIKVLILVFRRHFSALFFLGFWFATQLLSGLGSFSSETNEEGGGIAWWAHIGGFIFGLALGWIFKQRIKPEKYLA